jgi:hypothetical protein
MTALFLVRILLDANLSPGVLSQPDALESHIFSHSLIRVLCSAPLPPHSCRYPSLSRLFTLMVLSISAPDSIVGFLGNVFLRQTSNTRSVSPI